MNNNQYNYKKNLNNDMRKKYDDNTEFAKEFYEPLNTVTNMFDTDRPIFSSQLELKEFNRNKPKEKEL